LIAELPLSIAPGSTDISIEHSQMSSAMNNIRWFESSALDAPNLRSPQPCKRGIHCDYKLKAKDSEELVRACCSGVHPGEEGTGRRLFPARTLDDGSVQPACVRLTGAAQGFYERRRLRLSWAEWCEQKGIPFTPALPGQPFEPVVRVPIGGRAQAQAHVQAQVQPHVQAQVQPQVQPQPQIAYSEDQMSAFRGMSEYQERLDEQEDREYRAMSPAERAAYHARTSAAFAELRAWLEKERQNQLQSNPPVREPWQMRSRGFLGMPGGAENRRMSGGGSVPQPPKLTKNQRHRANRRIKLAAVDGFPTEVQMQSHCSDPNCDVTIIVPVQPTHSAAPPPLNLSPVPMKSSFPVSARGGECSPDCCCPLGYSCHDRSTPCDQGGSASPRVTTGIKYEEND
jgi:hypothetical protein